MIKLLQNKHSKKAILFSGTIFLLCVLVCGGYIYKFRQSMRAEIISTSKSSCSIGAQILAERFEGYRDLVEQGALRIEKNGARNDELISEILSEYEKAGKFKQAFYYRLDGTLLMSNGQTTTAISAGEDVNFDGMDFSDGAVVTARFDQNRRPQDIIAVAPIRQDGVRVGYLLGSRPADGEQLVPVSDYYDIRPVFYIVREDGQVISKYVELGEETEELEDVSNINLALEGLERLTYQQEQEVKLLAEGLQQGTAGCASLTLNDGDYNLVYVPITDITGWSIITVIPEVSVMQMVGTQIKSAIFAWGFILLLVLLLVIYINMSTMQSGKTIESIAYSDDLTCAKNLNYFTKKAMELIQTEKKLPYLVAQFDISGFRYINEAFGHERGDEILRTIAQYGEETFGSKEVFARSTADQFAVLMVDFEDIEHRMDNFSARINEYARNIDVSFPIILRTGYYRVKKGDRDISEMIDKANVARKTIQRDAKLWTVAYSEQMQRDIRIREEIESSMEQALEHGEFRVYLQPKYDILENRIAGAEALVRWIKADGTMVYPDQFIPIFEQNGFVERLDFYMLEEICKRLRSIRKEGLKVGPISVNQSRILLMNPDYVRKVQRILKKYAVPKDTIELELTETVFFDEKERIIAVMNELKQNDVVWDIDDFGSGFSSLNLLKDVPFDCLKIDRGFFSETSDSETSKLILRKIVEMADGLKVQCICEGVETEEQVELLRSIGCRYAQGFLYSKPIPLEEFIEKYVAE